jgi:hypothetical protein
LEYTVLARCKVLPWRADCLILKNESYDPSEPPKITRLSASQRNCIFSMKATRILYLWFRASLICINNCPTRCNTTQSIYYSPGSLYMFRVSATPIIRSTQNCNYSLRYCAATSLQRGQACLELAAQKI